MELTRSIPRETNQTLRVQRCPGKIAIEEACGSPFWNASLTVPEAPLITHFEGTLPFSEEVIHDIKGRLNDVDLRIKSMDQSGIGFEIISLTSPGIEGVADAKTAVEHPDRFGFFACVPMQDPKAAAQELERAVTKLGAKGVLINGYSNINPDNMSDVQYLDAEVCTPFWDMLSKLDVPMYIHPRNPPPNQQRIYWDYPAMCQAAFAFGNETAGHAVRIMCSGLLDKYPNTMMYYFQNNFIATLAGVRRESTLRNTLEELGEGRVLFSVDYPYESNEEASDWFDGLQMNENTRRQIASENAKRWLKLD
ncbi:hypothetical protein H2203_006966 [Taxawa tesnikishii (nom. ined.)]|nr:hypothetical protein H2203_006966 [Dothideales sp. JES 119]